MATASKCTSETDPATLWYDPDVKHDLKNLTRDELAAALTKLNEPAYRIGQVLAWIYEQRADSIAAMSNLPKPLREKLASEFDFTVLKLARKQGSQDTTQKFLWQLADGQFIESVLIPASPALYGDRSDRHTLCVSTQVGCAYGCKFCASGLDGFKRNLTPAEIVDQILAVERTENREPRTENRLINNLVFMGMGEPLANYDNLMRAIRLITAPWGVGIGARKITVSTSGLVPQIQKLADEPQQIRLAVSLHGATDEVRAKIMPVNRRWPLKELLAACDYYVKRKQRMMTFEYIMIENVNDALDQAEKLAVIARRLHAKVNLIPYNAVEGLPWKRPSDESQQAFHRILRRQGVTATLRIEKGHDIDAACGQLRLKTEREIASR
jgi:23S rRNA (adenine2503-C2)-methyltransferase